MFMTIGRARDMFPLKENAFVIASLSGLPTSATEETPFDFAINDYNSSLDYELNCSWGDNLTHTAGAGSGTLPATPNANVKHWVGVRAITNGFVGKWTYHQILVYESGVDGTGLLYENGSLNNFIDQLDGSFIAPNIDFGSFGSILPKVTSNQFIVDGVSITELLINSESSGSLTIPYDGSIDIAIAGGAGGGGGGLGGFGGGGGGGSALQVVTDIAVTKDQTIPFTIGAGGAGGAGGGGNGSNGGDTSILTYTSSGASGGTGGYSGGRTGGAGSNGGGAGGNYDAVGSAGAGFVFSSFNISEAGAGGNAQGGAGSYGGGGGGGANNTSNGGAGSFAGGGGGGGGQSKSGGAGASGYIYICIKIPVSEYSKVNNSLKYLTKTENDTDYIEHTLNSIIADGGGALLTYEERDTSSTNIQNKVVTDQFEDISRIIVELN